MAHNDHSTQWIWIALFLAVAWLALPYVVNSLRTDAFRLDLQADPLAAADAAMAKAVNRISGAW